MVPSSVPDDQEQHYGALESREALHGQERHDQGANAGSPDAGVLDYGECARDGKFHAFWRRVKCSIYAACADSLLTEEDLPLLKDYRLACYH